MTHDVVCDKCGNKMKIECQPRRYNRRGLGASDVGRIRKFGKARVQVVKIMHQYRAYTPQTAVSVTQVGYHYREWQKADGIVTAARLRDKGIEPKPTKLSKDHSIGGRMSELLGLHLVAVPNSEGEIRTRLEDKEENKWRTKPVPTYYLTKAGQECPLDPQWNPQLGSKSIEEELIYSR